MIVMFTIGFLLGNILISPLGDKFGRKITIIIPIIISGLINLDLIFTKSPG